MKSVFIVAILVALSPGVTAQSDVVVNDTVHYYFNKFYFKTGKGLSQLPKYNAPFATTTLVSHIGSRIVNNEPVVISGLHAFVARDSFATKPSIPVHLYLCTMQNNLPFFPPLDSVVFTISGNEQLKPMGGAFVSGLSFTLNSDFAVLMRNNSTSAGDTVLIGHTGSKTSTNTAASPAEKFGEGNGFVRYGGVFYNTRNSTIRGFGQGTDYEFCIAPIVQYTITSNHLVAPNADSVCTREEMVFTSLSSKKFLSPYFNLVEFARRWNHDPKFDDKSLQIKISTGPNPGDTLWQDVFPADSAVGWFFAPEDNLFFSPDPRVFLPPNTTNNQVTFSTDSARTKADGSDSLTCFYTNEFRTRFKTMAIYGRGPFYLYNDQFTICTSFCQKDGVGLTEGRDGQRIRVYPNPSNGLFRLDGLRPGTRVKVYSLAGILLLDEVLDNADAVDLSRCPAGIYILKANDASGEYNFRVMKE